MEGKQEKQEKADPSRPVSPDLIFLKFGNVLSSDSPSLSEINFSLAGWKGLLEQD